jgi:hypothetical protein
MNDWETTISERLLPLVRAGVVLMRTPLELDQA